jgi:beta-RFAP synthase
MTVKSVNVTTGSRVHFGLLSFNNPLLPHYGGVGLMIDRPRVRVSARRSSTWSVSGCHAQRVQAFTRRWCEFHGAASEPRCHLSVTEAPPEHVGLGLGTQLGLAVAAALNSLFCSDQADDLPRLAACVNRGQRSAIGCHGFLHGGLIVEFGKSADQSISELIDRIDLPPDWRVVLIRPLGARGLSGQDEHDAFRALPSVSQTIRQHLVREISDEMLPAVRSADFERFCESVYRYGRVAGSCFAAYQCGSFATPTLADTIETLRRAGVRGVGQSSWGPTLFAFQSNEANALSLVDWIRTQPGSSSRTHELLIARPARSGARIEIEP